MHVAVIPRGGLLGVNLPAPSVTDQELLGWRWKAISYHADLLHTWAGLSPQQNLRQMHWKLVGQREYSQAPQSLFPLQNQ